MALIIKNSLLISLENNAILASNIGIKISKKILSIPYELSTGNIMSAEIMGIEEIGGKNITELEGEKIKLYLIKGTISNDYLLITKDDWSKLRDYGLLADEVDISIKINEVEKDTEKIKIYEKRDLLIDGI
jgi:hypothetical protein